MNCQVCGVSGAEASCSLCQEWAFSPGVRIQVVKFGGEYYLRVINRGNNRVLVEGELYSRKRGVERLIQILFPCRTEIEYVDEY